MINAFKAGALDVVLSLENCEFALSTAVVTESIELREEVQKHLDAGRLIRSDETSISAMTVASISGSYNLGIGESECLALCQLDGKLFLWSDDRRARNVTCELLGANRVVGTRDLLLICVQQALLSPLDAYGAYELARSRGAFLPLLMREFFYT